MGSKPEKINVQEKFESFSDHWNPKILGELNGQHVKIARFKGDFVEHLHENEDELFFVIEGTLYIELEEKTLELKAGEFVIIPRGILHKPFAKEEAKILLFEPNTTLNTGNVKSEHTRTKLDRLD